MHAALRGRVRELRRIGIEPDLGERVEEAIRQRVVEDRHEVGPVGDAVPRHRGEAHADRPGAQQRFDRGEHAGGADQVHLEDAAPVRHRTRDPGGEDDRVEVSDAAHERVDLLRVGDVARDGIHLPAQVGGDGFDGLEVHGRPR